jgi:aspartyl-tRNA(Asn)/glutamyl-tRNA(Gln) amidotransferase subunit A
MVTARDRLEQALERIGDAAGEGSRTFLTTYADEARAAADAADRRSTDGTTLGPLDGVIVSIKDLFDVAGEPTRAGSKILADAPPAASDAPVVQRLRDAGAIIVGKTNMSEFAFTGVGANPHYGTPGNPADRKRIPGGSSSGAAVAVADGMCEISIGTDTGGSTRIPAASCGLVGYKPTKHRVPTDGAFPLSWTLDSVGPIARSVADCAKADAVLAGEKQWSIEPAGLNGLRLAVPQNLVLDDLDFTVSRALDVALGQLIRADAIVSAIECPEFHEMERVNGVATIPTAEAWRIHRDWLAERGKDYDQRVKWRIELGSRVDDATYLHMLEELGALANAMDARLSQYDALVLPTTPIVAPRFEDIATDEGFQRANGLLLRNTAIANFFGLCAISLPLAGTLLPLGLMIVARRDHDRRLFNIAAAIERLCC